MPKRSRKDKTETGESPVQMQSPKEHTPVIEELFATLSAKELVAGAKLSISKVVP
jgi:hypothetical protein